MNNADANKLLKQYEKMFKMFVEHMKECPNLEKKVLKEFDFDE
jgi:hypothetical protein